MRAGKEEAISTISKLYSMSKSVVLRKIMEKLLPWII